MDAAIQLLGTEKCGHSTALKRMVLNCWHLTRAGTSIEGAGLSATVLSGVVVRQRLCT
jgi:hypothetical protein